MDNCIEYKFLTLIEEINRLLEIRRAKAISPHEYIRRMIFSLRKTCEWLHLNCQDILLPDLLQTGKDNIDMKKVDSKKTKKIDLITPQKITEKNNSLPQAAASSQRINTATPITFDNNILYEIERSQSCSSQKSNSNSLAFNNLIVNSSATLNCSINSINSNAERLNFLQKLQNAAQTPPPVAAAVTPAAQTPLITVRKDLMATNMSPTFSARCNPCNLIFETLASLEIHNAIHHNDNNRMGITPLDEHEEERKKIIALFEDDSPDE